MELEGIRTAGITAVPGNYREFLFLRGVREVIRFLEGENEAVEAVGC